MPDIEVKREHGRYAVYVDGEFWATCENVSEVAEEKDYILDRCRKPELCLA